MSTSNLASGRFSSQLVESLSFLLADGSNKEQDGCYAPRASSDDSRLSYEAEGRDEKTDDEASDVRRCQNSKGS
jgi:hypothetical protein